MLHTYMHAGWCMGLVSARHLGSGGVEGWRRQFVVVIAKGDVDGQGRPNGAQQLQDPDHHCSRVRGPQPDGDQGRTLTTPPHGCEAQTGRGSGPQTGTCVRAHTFLFAVWCTRHSAEGQPRSSRAVPQPDGDQGRTLTTPHTGAKPTTGRGSGPSDTSRPHVSARTIVYKLQVCKGDEVVGAAAVSSRSLHPNSRRPMARMRGMILLRQYGYSILGQQYSGLQYAEAEGSTHGRLLLPQQVNAGVRIAACRCVRACGHAGMWPHARPCQHDRHEGVVQDSVKNQDAFQ